MRILIVAGGGALDAAEEVTALSEALQAPVLALWLAVVAIGGGGEVSGDARGVGFGLVTAEALGKGLPAVGFADCPGTNMLIRHDVNGLLVEAVLPGTAF